MNHKITVRAVDPVTGQGKSASRSVSVAAAASLVDDYAPVGAYALRLVSTSYSGPVLKVRRATDGVTADLSVHNGLVSPLSPMSSLSDLSADTTFRLFAGSSDIRVDTWYDQSGGGRHLTQATEAKQPFLATAGVLERDDEGAVAVLFTYHELVSLGYNMANDDIALVMAMTNRKNTSDGYFAWMRGVANNDDYTFGMDGGTDLEVRLTNTSGQVKEHTGTSFGPESMIVASRATGSVVEAWHHLSKKFSVARTASVITGMDDLRVGRYGNGAGGSQGCIISLRECFVFDSTVDVDAFMVAQNVGLRIYTRTPHTGALLRQVFGYEVTLYDYLETLTIAGQTLTHGQSLTYASAGADVDDLYPAVVSLRDNRPLMNLLRRAADTFVLDDGAGGGYEGSGALRHNEMPGSGNEGVESESAWIYSFTLPGLTNPYYGLPALGRRILGQSIVHLLELDRQVFNQTGNQNDYVGQRFNEIMHAMKAVRSMLTAKERTAMWKSALRVAVAWRSRGGPKDATANMDTTMISGLAVAYKLAIEDGEAAKASYFHDTAKIAMLGSTTNTPLTATGTSVTGVLFAPAGYVAEEEGPEASYNGISLYHLVAAAGAVKGVAGWEWLWDTGGVIDLMCVFKAYQIFPDPDGVVSGPSGYSKRTALPYAGDQSSSQGRDYLAAMLSSHGVSVNGRRFTNGWSPSAPSVGTLEAELPGLLSSLTTSALGATAMVPVNVFTEYWSERYGPVFWEWYEDGFHATYAALISGGDDSLSLPVELTASYNRVFGKTGEQPQFWAHKASDGTRDFAMFIETVADKGSAYTGGGHIGGTLQSFWTEDAGLVWNTRHAKHDGTYSNMAVYAEIIPAHHVWGKKGTNIFTISTVQQHTVVYDSITNPTTVRVTTTPRVYSTSWAGVVSVQRDITVKANGVEVTDLWTSDSADTDITELWSSLPVYIKAQVPTNATSTIEYWDGGAYQTLTTTPVSSTRLRVGRNHGSGAKYVYVVFTGSQTVHLASAQYDPDYQIDDRHRNVHIDLHPNTGVGQAVASATVTYAIQTQEP